MIQIRPANEGDLDWLVGELRDFDTFYKTKKRLFGDESIVRAKLREAIHYHVCLIAEKSEDFTPTGFILGLLRPHFYNPDIRLLSELFWWVVPRYRHTISASLLMDEFIAIGKAEADWITLNMSPWTRIKKRSLQQRGFEVSDQVFLMEV